MDAGILLSLPRGERKFKFSQVWQASRPAVNCPLCLCAESLQQVYHVSQKGGQPQQVPPLCKLPHCCYLLVVLLHWLQKWEIYYSGSSIIEGTHDSSWPSRKKTHKTTATQHQRVVSPWSLFFFFFKCQSSRLALDKQHLLLVVLLLVVVVIVLASSTMHIGFNSLSAVCKSEYHTNDW